jgi:hypothetical protein
MAPGDALSGSDQSVTIEGDRDDVVKVLLGDEVGHEDTAVIEPALDE